MRIFTSKAIFSKAIFSAVLIGAAASLTSMQGMNAQTADPAGQMDAAPKPAKKERPLSPAAISKMFKTAQTPEARAAAFSALAPFVITGDPSAQRLQARELARDARCSDALAALAPLIAANDEEGLDMAAKLISNRKSGLDDPAVALDINERLMELGDLDALAKVAKAHLEGQAGRISPEDIRSALEVAASGGISNLSSYLAEFQTKGIGGSIDKDAAIVSLKAASEAGAKGSKYDLAALLLDSDKAEDIKQSLTLLTELAASASPGESAGAKIKLITGHALGDFGAASDVQVAMVLTGEVLASETAAKAVPGLLRAASKQDAPPEWRDLILQAVQARIDSGDETHLNSLFAHFAASRDTAFQARAQTMYDTYGTKISSDLVAGFLIGQAIRAGNPMPQAETLVGYLDLAKTPAALEKAYLATTFNPNLFTYFLQHFATARSQYSGRLSGQMDSATLRAVMQICADAGGKPTCEAGPLKRKNAQTIARAVATMAATAN